MSKVLYSFIPGERVRITSGLLHGFNATIVTVDQPDRIAVVVEELDGDAPVIVKSECLEPCDARQSRG